MSLQFITLVENGLRKFQIEIRRKHYPVDTGRKLNVHKPLDLRSVSTGYL